MKSSNDCFGDTETRVYQTPNDQLVVIRRNMDGLNTVKQVGQDIEFRITGVRKYGEYIIEDEVEVMDGVRGVDDDTGWIEDAWRTEIIEGEHNLYGFHKITPETVE